VDGLLIEASSFRYTWGTPPSAGIDFEPDAANQRLKDIIVRNCDFADNYGEAIEVFLPHLTRSSEPVSITFEDCRVSSRLGAGIRVSKIMDEGPQGSVTFRNCVVENTEAYGIKVQDKSADGARVVFENCRLKNVGINRSFADVWTPLLLRMRAGEKVKRFGGIEFNNCTIDDDRDRDAVTISGGEETELVDISGKIAVKNRHGVKTNLATRGAGLKLEVGAETP
jgi:hypothetical protein